MDAARAVLARENAALKAALAAAQTRGLEVAAELAVARAKASEDMALIAQQKLRIAKLERQVYGQRSERSARLIDQLALTFEELEASATEDELAAEKAVARTTTVAGFTRKRPERNTFPDHRRQRSGSRRPRAVARRGSSSAVTFFMIGPSIVADAAPTQSAGRPVSRPYNASETHGRAHLNRS